MIYHETKSMMKQTSFPVIQAQCMIYHETKSMMRQTSFPVIHKVDNVGIVQLQMKIDWKLLPVE